MDQRHPAGNPGQSNQALPQRRLYVYNRPFADIRPSRPQAAQHAVQRPVAPPAQTKPQVQPQSPPQSIAQPQPASAVSMDGFIQPNRQTHQPIAQVEPFQLQQPTPVTAPAPHPQPQQIPPTPQQAHQQPASIHESEWQMQMPEDLRETRSPINAMPAVSGSNTNWRPVQQAAPQPGANLPQEAWQQTPVFVPPAVEMPTSHANARQRKGRSFSLKSIFGKGAKVMVIVLLATGLFVAISMIRANQSAQNAAGNFNQAESDELGIFNTQPSEDPGATTGTLGVSRSIDAPKAVKIDAIDMAARVVAVGTSRNSFIKAPANIYDLGWYEGSAKPGSNGVVLLHGHIAGPTRPGALYEVALLKRGDVISVERGDGKIYNYTVQAVEFFENDQIDMSKMLTPYNPNRNGLNIMTAGGRYNTETGAYELRAAIYAVEDTN